MLATPRLLGPMALVASTKAQRPTPPVHGEGPFLAEERVGEMAEDAGADHASGEEGGLCEPTLYLSLHISPHSDIVDAPRGSSHAPPHGSNAPPAGVGSRSAKIMIMVWKASSAHGRLASTKCGNCHAPNSPAYHRSITSIPILSSMPYDARSDAQRASWPLDAASGVAIGGAVGCCWAAAAWVVVMGNGGGGEADDIGGALAEISWQPLRLAWLGSRELKQMRSGGDFDLDSAMHAVEKRGGGFPSEGLAHHAEGTGLIAAAEGCEGALALGLHF